MSADYIRWIANPHEFVAGLHRDFSEYIDHNQPQDGDLLIEGIKFTSISDLRTERAELSFKLFIHERTLPRTASIKIEKSSLHTVENGNIESKIDVSRIVKLKWDLFASMRHHSVSITLEKFFKWWCEYAATPVKGEQDHHSLLSLIGLPDDVFDGLILPRIDFMTQFSLSYVSKSWRRAIDREETWARAWFSCIEHLLSSFSLATCPTFKSRFLLLCQSEINMNQRRGIITPLVRGVNLDAGTTYWGDLTVDFSCTNSPSSYVSYATISSHGDSYSATTIETQTLVDISAWPSTTTRVIHRRSRARFRLLGHTWFVNMSKAKFCDVREKLFALPGPNVDLSSVISTSPAFSTYSVQSITNSDPDYPWILVKQLSSPTHTKIHLYDLARRVFVLEKVSLPVAQASSLAYFHGLYFVLRHDYSIVIFKIDLENAGILQILGPNILLSQLVHERHAALRGIPVELRHSISHKISSNMLLIAPLASGASLTLFWCDLTLLASCSNENEVEQLLLSNNMEIFLDSPVSSMSMCGNFAALCGRNSSVIVDLKMKRAVCAISHLIAIKNVLWIDQTTLVLDTNAQSYVVDFVGRTFLSPRPCLEPPLLAGLDFPIYYLVNRGTSLPRKVVKADFPRGYFAQVFQHLWGLEWPKYVQLDLHGHFDSIAFEPAIYVFRKGTKRIEGAVQASELVYSLDKDLRPHSTFLSFLEPNDLAKIPQQKPVRFDAKRRLKNNESVGAETQTQVLIDDILPKIDGTIEAVALGLRRVTNSTAVSGWLTFDLEPSAVTLAFESM